MNMEKRGLRLAVTAAGVAGAAVILALAVVGASPWRTGPPAHAQFTHCGDGENLFEWPNAHVTLTPNSGFAGTEFTAEVTGIPTDAETREFEILWDWDIAEPDEELIGSSGLGADETSITLSVAAPEDAEADTYWVAACWERPSSDTWYYKRATFAVVEPTPTPLYTPTPSPTASLTPEPDFTPTATPEPTAKVLNCPRANKWAIAVWEGDDDTATGEAFATCGEGAVEAAYYIDPESQNWLRWFVGLPDISNLPTLAKKQGVIAHGRFAPAPTPTQTPTPPPNATTLTAVASAGDVEVTVSDSSFLAVGDCIRFEGSLVVRQITAISGSTLTLDEGLELDHAAGEWVFEVQCPTPTPEPSSGEGEMHNCPMLGKWGIAVWDGADIDTSGALSNCAEEVDFAYDLDPESQQWRRWFAGLPEISNFETVKGGQGLIAHGKATLPSALGRIAFVSNRDANDLEIYAVNSDGTGLTNLTKSLGADDSPAWSPDGSKLAFESYRDGNWEVYVMNADGSGSSRLTTEPTDDEEPVWSPDGSRIAFVSWRSGASEVYVMNADGSGQTRLSWFPSGGPTHPTWSGDGSKIAFESWGDIWVADAVAAGQPVPVPTNLTNIAPSLMAIEPVWSPDGTKIAYRCCDDDDWEIYVMNADGTAHTNLTNSPGWDSGHAWSPDGTQIAFNSGREGDIDRIYVMKADGTSPTRLTDGTDHNPSWAPDSARLVFECTISTNVEVCVVDANGVTDVSNHAWVDDEPVWTP